MLVAAACSVGERPVLSEDGAGAVGVMRGNDDAAGSNATAAPTTTEPPVELPDLAALGELPPALLTPTGVVVPVLAAADGGYLVHSPCGNEVSVTWGHPLDMADAVIDAGHGGDERGAIGPDGESEADLNLDIALRTATALEKAGVSVALTRTADYRIPIRFRAAIADQLQAKVFVSIHHNSPTPTPAPTDGPGTEVYVQAGSAESARLGGLLYEEIVGSLQQFDADWASRDDAGVLTVVNDSGEDAYGINRYPATPSALAEFAYLSNPTEALLLSTSEYRQTAADALALAIVRYLQTDAPGSGFIDEPRLFTPSGLTGGSDGCVDPPLEAAEE